VSVFPSNLAAKRDAIFVKDAVEFFPRIWDFRIRKFPEYGRNAPNGYSFGRKPEVRFLFRGAKQSIGLCRNSCRDVTLRTCLGFYVYVIVYVIRVICSYLCVYLGC